MAKVQPKIVQNIFEARYERGYRYLDRCGDTMVILEEALPKISKNSIWMPEEMRPLGARMKCPDMDLALIFDASRLCLDQDPAGVECPFASISKYAFDTIVSKFDIRKTTRLGNRKRYVLPADSIEGAEALSVKRAPLDNWPPMSSGELEPKSYDVTSVLENKERSRGIRFSISPIFKVEAPLTLDRRLTMAPHLLEKGQREALIAQLKRQKQREKEPLAGLSIDIDYWWLNPEKTSIEEFLDISKTQIEESLEAFLEK
jgi:hypothetical protein